MRALRDLFIASVCIPLWIMLLPAVGVGRLIIAMPVRLS